MLKESKEELHNGMEFEEDRLAQEIEEIELGTAQVMRTQR